MALLTGNKTYSDYENTPEGGKFQLIDGEIQEMTSPTFLHQLIVQNLNFLFSAYVRTNKAGRVLSAPMDVTLSPKDTVQPDLLYIDKLRYSVISEKKIDGAPDIVIEVLSPSTAYLDLKYKKDLYEISGVKEYWIVDPEDNSVEIYFNEANSFNRIQKSKKDGLLSSKILSGLEINIKDIFAVE